MSRVDYELIALAIRKARRVTYATPQGDHLQSRDELVIDIVVAALVPYLRQQDPNFCEDRFMRATITPSAGDPDYPPPHNWRGLA